MPHRHTRRAAHPAIAAALDLAAWAALPLFEALDDLGSWLTDLKPTEIAHQAIRALIWLAIGAAIVVSLAACDLGRRDQPGPLPAEITATAVATSAVRVVQP
jgi:hypothetical protein